MDPNANIAEQIKIARSIVEVGNMDEADIERIGELVLALDEWLRSGGSAPTRWAVMT